MIVAVKKPRPIARGDFAKRREHHLQRFRGDRRLFHLCEQLLIDLPDVRSRLFLVIGKNMCGTMNPGIALLHI